MPEEADYEAVPVEAYGLAMLRGMGWKPGEGIGRTFNQWVLGYGQGATDGGSEQDPHGYHPSKTIQAGRGHVTTLINLVSLSTTVSISYLPFETL